MNYNEFKAGYKDEELNKVVKELVTASDNYVVYIDEDNRIQWGYHLENGVFDKNAWGEVINEVMYWESINEKLFDDDDKYELNSLLAESLVRVLEGSNYYIASKILEKSVERIKEKGKLLLRGKYMRAGIRSFVVALVLLLFFTRICFNNLLECFSQQSYDYIIAGLLGSIGGFVSMLISSRNYKPSIVSDNRLHSLDGFSRILLGCLAGFIVAMGIKANMVFGFVNDLDNARQATFFICTIAGASEVILPNIIKQVEEK